ncbi:hypothetical protein ADK74_18995 [Streptomyces decoyicus]|nr:hypothetical protein ADK74_18995 [Streptomyces decoyicus]
MRSGFRTDLVKQPAKLLYGLWLGEQQPAEISLPLQGQFTQHLLVSCRVGAQRFFATCVQFIGNNLRPVRLQTLPQAS